MMTLRLFTIILVTWTAVAASDLDSEPAVKDDGTQMSPISGDVDRPRRHFRLRSALELPPAEALRHRAALAPGRIRTLGVDGGADVSILAQSKHASIPFPCAWQPFFNNYANETAASYLRYENAGRLPVGSVLAKDSFAVTETGEILLGSLSLMGKMPPGFNAVSGNWKYALIQPDGTVFGETGGQEAKRVEYCIACHLVREQFDHLYFVSERVRSTVEKE